MTTSTTFAPSFGSVETSFDMGSFKARGIRRRFAFGENGDELRGESDQKASFEFRPTEELRGVEVSVAPRIGSSELFAFALLALVGSMLLIVIDAFAKHNVVSGTLIVMLFVSAIGLAVTGMISQRDMSARARRP